MAAPDVDLDELTRGERASHRLAALVKRYEHGSRVPGWEASDALGKDPSVVPDLASTPVPEQLQTLFTDYMRRYPDHRSASIPCLRAAQKHHGWLSPTAVEQVAAVMALTPGYLIAVATFYDMFEHEPVGPNTIYVCTNISCSLRGADELYAKLRETCDGDPAFNVRPFECLGACDIAPMASVNGIYVGPMTLEDAPRLADQLRAGEEPLPDKQLHKRPVAETYWNPGGSS